MAFCPLYDLWGPLRQILIAFSCPFELMKPIAAYFDGILPSFELTGKNIFPPKKFPPKKILPKKPNSQSETRKKSPNSQSEARKKSPNSQSEARKNSPNSQSEARKIPQGSKMPSKSAYLGPISQKGAKGHQNMPQWAPSVKRG